MTVDDILWSDAHAQAELLAAGELTATELTQLQIARIAAVDPGIGAISHRSFDLARAQAAAAPRTGVMAGVGWLAKDSLPYAGLPAPCGSRVLAGARPARRQFPLADRLNDAGMVILGKSTVPEFSLLPTTESVLTGATANPWQRDHSAGGSSGGAAAAVAAGMVPVAHAADGGGSIRIPASCCGVIGLKPSRGANLRARGFHLLEDILVGDAMLGRSVRDVAWFARWLRPASFDLHAKPRSLRIARCDRGMNGRLPESEVSVAIDHTARLCADLGHHVEQIDRLPEDLCMAGQLFELLWQFLARDGVDHFRDAEGRLPDVSFEPWALGLAARAQALDPVQLGQCYTAMAGIAAAAERFHARYDVLLSPVVASPPPRLGVLAGTRDFDALFTEMFDYIAYTPLQNVTGAASISLPLALSPNGLPIGSMLSGGIGSDETLLRLAAEIEVVAPWNEGRRAPL